MGARPPSVLLFLSIAAAACSPSTASLSRDVAALELEMRQRDRAIADAEGRVDALLEATSEIVSLYRETTEGFRVAEEAFEETAAMAEAASTRFRESSEDYELARSHWQKVTLVLLAAAASTAVGKSVCGNPVSTQRFRRRLETVGINLAGKDIDHIVPKALGGPDHPWNYQVLESSVNRSLGADFGVAKCWNAGPKCVLAVGSWAVSALACK